MNGDLMTGHEFLLKKRGKGNDARTNDKHSREKVVLVQKREEVGRVIGRAVIVCETPLKLRGASCDIS